MRARVSLLMLICACIGVEASGQELVQRFKEARIKHVAQTIEARDGIWLQPAPVEHLPVLSDFIALWLDSRRPVASRVSVIPEPPPPSFAVDSVRVFSRLERVVFSREYREARWAFMQGRRLTQIDTTFTSDIRARMQARYGSPTHTLAEMDSVAGRQAEELVQFEYWLMVNDSIPVMILDANGPLGRGVIVATDSKWRDQLDAIRYGLLQPLFDDPRRAAYVDYFYQVDSDVWYATGFDGATSFFRRIEPPNLALGRPDLHTYVTAPPDR